MVVEARPPSASTYAAADRRLMLRSLDDGDSIFARGREQGRLSRYPSRMTFGYQKSVEVKLGIG